MFWWVQIYPVPEWRMQQGKKWGRWRDAPIVPSAHCTSQCGQCYDLGLIQLVRSRFRNVMCPKMRLVDYLNILNEQVFHWWIFFLPWWHGHNPRWHCHHLLSKTELAGTRMHSVIFPPKIVLLTKNENNQFTKYSVTVVTLHELIKPMCSEHVP